MCFSATASFAAGAALLPAGVYCTAQALRKRPRAIFMGVVPLVFGVQQFSEGFVWRALHAGDAEELRRASLVFLFFAVPFWPFWFPLMSASLEADRIKKRLFIGLAALSTFWMWAMYLPLLLGPPELLTTREVHHSVQYAYPDLKLYEYVPRNILRVLYFAMVALPLAMGSESLGIVPGLFLAATVIVAGVVYDYAFVSVWCFFAAVLSLSLVYMFRTMAKESAIPATS